MKNSGFTLIELMIVVAIIGILASIAIPEYQAYVVRAQVVESFSITGEMKSSIQDYYEEHGRFPSDNAEAGLPDPEYLIGNYIESIDVADGAMHVHFGNYVNSGLDGEVLSIRPMVVIGSPASPISWNCGYRKPPEGMEAVGEDLTSVRRVYLPSACR